MRAIAYRQAGPIDRQDALVEVDLPDPTPEARDLLVEVRAVSVNPADTKLRKARPPANGQQVLGYDAAGVVRAVGGDATLFKPGDEVYYAGDVDRPGTDAELHLVDERIVGRKPASLSWAEVAALPLTTLTAWEALFDRLDVRRPVPGGARALLVIGSGGVGSIAVQIARSQTDLAVIATASGEDAVARIRDLGAHHVVDHTRPLAPQVEALGLGKPSFVFSTTHTVEHVKDIIDLMAPQGRLSLIDDPDTFDIMPFKPKAISVHWELMFTRPMFATADMGVQGDILNEVADLVDAGKLRTTLAERLAPISAENLRRAHDMVERGAVRGKVVLEGWSDPTA